jgi:hypothetical protein
MSDIKIGDAVRWTASSQRGRTFSMELKEGVVESIDGDVATVRTGKTRHRKQIPLSSLSVRGQATQIDRVIQAVRDQSYGKKDGE